MLIDKLGENQDYGFSDTLLLDIFNAALVSSNSDLAIAAANSVIGLGLPIDKCSNEINANAKIVISGTEKETLHFRNQCIIHPMLKHLLRKFSPPDFHWINVFVNDAVYIEVHRRLLRMKKYENTDASGWVLLADTINDLILNSLTGHDLSLGTYTLGRIGSWVSKDNANKKLITKYPLLYTAMERTHALRLQSDQAHPIAKSTGNYTRFIRYGEISKLRKVLREGYGELCAKW